MMNNNVTSNKSPRLNDWLKAVQTSFFFLALTFTACQNDKTGKIYSATAVKEFTPEQYKDDPDLTSEFSDSTYYGRTFSHDAIDFISEDNKFGAFTVVVKPKNGVSAELIIPHVCLDEFTPTVPQYLRSDKDLSDIALFNQQFNRVQVKFLKDSGAFTVKGYNLEAQKVVRIDVAKNCLEVPKWEIILFSRDPTTKKELPIYHGWFNFPQSLHTELLMRKGFSAEEAVTITKSLTKWMVLTPQNRLNLDNLRTFKAADEKSVHLEALNNARYPLFGERLKKFKNIIYPFHSDSIPDFLTDSTQFATFQKEGIYNREEPRTTQLGRFKTAESAVKVRVIQSNNQQKSVRPEIEFRFLNEKNNVTRLIVGGFDLKKIKPLTVENANDGMTMPMGIANHNFNQSYKELTLPENSTENNPCYALLLDDDGVWLDSHAIGLDGLLFHFDDKDAKKLHIWLLSFERHALVGHYTVTHDWSTFSQNKSK